MHNFRGGCRKRTGQLGVCELPKGEKVWGFGCLAFSRSVFWVVFFPFFLIREIPFLPHESVDIYGEHGVVLRPSRV